MLMGAQSFERKSIFIYNEKLGAKSDIKKHLI